MCPALFDFKQFGNSVVDLIKYIGGAKMLHVGNLYIL